MTRMLCYMCLGYLLGSLLFAKFFGRVFGKGDIVSESPDRNPGTFNAFRYGGFFCGAFTLCADLLKGFLPVFLYLHSEVPMPLYGISFVMAAPVFGHAFSVFHRFKGGKGVAVSFGCLLGLLPDVRPVLILAFFFLFFSLVFKISPHYYRTMFTYGASAVSVLFSTLLPPVRVGVLMIAGIVITKLLASTEERGKLKVKIGWKS